LPLLLVFRLHVGYNVPSLNPFLAYSLYWLWALLVIIPFSFLFYIWIEKPWIQVGAKLLSPKGALHKK
jgi:peptidoglycan/LPS O-acetylase OafA/YrhL